MSQAHKLDCESEAVDCRFVIQSENETEAIGLTKNHLRVDHGEYNSDDQLRKEHLQVG